MFRLLIAEDEMIEREALCTLIRREYGSRLNIAGEAGSGAEAIEKALKLQPDIILMDIRLPGINGLDALEKIRRSLPQTVCAVVTAYSTFEYARRAIRLGVQDYLIKPYSVTSLRETMDALLEKALSLAEERDQQRLSEEKLAFLSRKARGRNEEKPAEDADPRDVLDELYRYIENHHCEEFGLDDLSRLFGMSKYHLSRRFSARYGFGIKEFTIRCRVATAEKLLSRGFPVSEVAYRCGFKDPNYFSRAMRKQTGEPPGSFTKRK